MKKTLLAVAGAVAFMLGMCSAPVRSQGSGPARVRELDEARQLGLAGEGDDARMRDWMVGIEARDEVR